MLNKTVAYMSLATLERRPRITSSSTQRGRYPRLGRRQCPCTDCSLFLTQRELPNA